ncbi:hypothetical protein GCM10023335_10010 [Streptomyces siamensis]|uniref:Uncharacterized protein n=1 Tax=Streptomyces siamensis TaxID=1274986 RepID=A0ABP9IHU5_9ACTN
MAVTNGTRPAAPTTHNAVTARLNFMSVPPVSLPTGEVVGLAAEREPLATDPALSDTELPGE